MIDIQASTKTLHASAIALASEGDVEQALDLWRATTRSTRCFIEDGPTLSCVMVGVLAFRESARSLEYIVGGIEIQKPILCDLMNDLDQPAWRDGVFRTMDLERVLLLDMANWWNWRAFGWLPVTTMGRPGFQRNFMRFHEQALTIMDAITRPTWEAIPVVQEHAAKLDAEWELKSHFIIPSATLAGVFGHLDDTIRSECQAQVARVALACKAWRNEHGAWPQSLDLLAPEFFETIPLDPFTGRSLLYSLQDGGFLIYSVGPNGIDEGGDDRLDAESDDIAWSEQG